MVKNVMKNTSIYRTPDTTPVYQSRLELSGPPNDDEDLQDDLAQFQPIQVVKAKPSQRNSRDKSGRLLGCTSWFLFVAVAFLALLLGYSFFPGRINLLILGIDDRAQEGVLGRSDTMILTSVSPIDSYVGMFSIPRDLWVTIPDYGENRINTAHFFAEAEQPGTGPMAALEVVESNFGVRVDYYLRFQFDSFKTFIDALGGVEIDLPEAKAGYSAGKHRLNAEEALAFVRDRSGADDFYRMENGRFVILSVFKELLLPKNWVKLPELIGIMTRSLDTNIPFWQMPRLVIGIIKVGPGGIDSRGVTRDMVAPFTTSGGAQVLAPNWEAINPVVSEMFEGES